MAGRVEPGSFPHPLPSLQAISCSASCGPAGISVFMFLGEEMHQT